MLKISKVINSLFPLTVGSLCFFSNSIYQLPTVLFISLMSYYVEKIYISNQGIKFKNKEILKIFFSSFAYFVSQFHWSIFPLFLDKKFYWIVPFSISLIPLIHSIILIAFIVFFTKILKSKDSEFNNFKTIITISFAWFLMELFRKKLIFTGFPWHPIGSIISVSDTFSQIARIIKIDGLNLLVPFYIVNLFLSMKCLFVKRKINTLSLIMTIIIPICLSIYGNYRIENNSEYFNVNKNGLKIITIQPNISIQDIFDHHKTFDNFIKIIKKTNFCLNNYDADIVIWPEGSIPYHYEDENEQLMDYLSKELYNKNDFILLSGTTISSQNNQFFNSMIGVKVSKKSYKFWQYNKQILVPYGEYVPLQKYMPKFLESITGYVASFNSDEDNTLLKIQKNKIELTVNPLICYESIFSDHPNFKLNKFKIQKEDNKKTTKERKLIVNISNDGWLMNSIGVYQHALASKFRAIENNQPVIRVANGGIGIVYDNLGREVQKINSDTSGCIKVVLN